MKNTKFFKSALIAFALVLVFANSTFAKKLSTLKELPQKMMWQIDSPTGTTIYVFGSVHLLNEELANIDEEAAKMFVTADEVYGELSLETIAGAQEATMKLMIATMEFDSDGKPKNVGEYLTKAEVEQLVGILRKASEDAAKMERSLLEKTFLSLPPWSLSTIVDAYGFSELGYESAGHDAIFYQAAAELNKKIRGLDTWEAQAKALSYGTYEEQVASLKMSLEFIRTGKTKKIVKDLFDAYQKDDRQAMIKVIEDEDNVQEKYVSKEYVEKKTELLITKRNESWATQIEKMLKQKNKKIFIFAGVAHWLGEGNVFDILIKKGILEEAK